jgi:hypothetical protein
MEFLSKINIRPSNCHINRTILNDALQPNYIKFSEW